MMENCSDILFAEDSSCSFESFNCGVRSINNFIRKGLLEKVALGHCIARVCVERETQELIGVVTVSPYCLDRKRWGVRDNPDLIPQDVVSKFRERYPVPGWLIGQLAISRAYQGRGYGEYLLMDALDMIRQRAANGCGSIVVVHTENDRVKPFYLKYGFRQLPPDDSSVVFLPVRELSMLG